MSDDRMTVDSIRATWGGTGYGGAATPYQREAIDTVRFLLAELDDTITIRHAPVCLTRTDDLSGCDCGVTALVTQLMDVMDGTVPDPTR